MAKQYASEALDTYHEPHIIKMLDETKVCLCCGKILKYLPDKDKRRNRGYCSLACYYKLLPKLAYACKEYGMKPRELIIYLLNRHTATATAGLLGVGKPQLYEYIKKYHIRKKVIYE